MNFSFLFSSLKRQQAGSEKELTLQSDWFKGAPSLQHNSASWWWGLVTMRVASRPRGKAAAVGHTLQLVTNDYSCCGRLLQQRTYAAALRSRPISHTCATGESTFAEAERGRTPAVTNTS